MRHLTWSLLLAPLLACHGGDDGPPPPPTVTDTEEHSGTTLIESGWPVGDIGNIQIAHHVNTNRTEVMAMALDSSAGFVNMAQCTLFDQLPCIGAFPALEDFTDLDPDQRVDPDVVRTRFLGFEIEVGKHPREGIDPYVLPYKEDTRTGLGFYAIDATRQGFQTGEIGATWEGQWERRKSFDDLSVSEPIQMVAPQPGASLFVPNGTRLPIEWVPTGEGEITLLVANRFTIHRLYHLVDDGYFELDVDSLGLTGQLEDLTVTLTRWNVADIQWTGHYMREVASSDVAFNLELANVGARDELYVVDSCTEASGMPPLQSGDWWARLDGFDNSLNPSNYYPNCLRETGNWYAAGGGRDGLAKVELPPKSVINLQYTHFTESASVYFVSDCTRARTCVAGIDADNSPGAPETLSLFNKSDDLETWYLVLDSTADESTDSEVFTMDVTIEPLVDPEMYDLCVDAAAATPTLTTAAYYEEFVAYTADLNPGVGGCATNPLPGPEALMPFTLGPNQTLTITADMPTGDVGLYVLANGCSVANCIGGANGSTLDPETLVVTNNSATATDLILVVDSGASGMRPFTLAVTFQ